MSKKKKNKKSKKLKKANKNNVVLVLEYYNHIFNYLHLQLSKSTTNFEDTPNECLKFWSIVPSRVYQGVEANQLLLQYLKLVEEKLASTIKKQSLAYWLHLYRRISPKSIGKNSDPKTTLAVRSTLEAAFQKYAKIKFCNRIALSSEVGFEKIFRGLLIMPEFKMIRDELEKHPQLVLTDFGLEELIEMYRVERLSYEIWRTMAAMRAVAKGALLNISNKEPFFIDIRDSELARLIEYYDEKNRVEGASITGVMFDQDQTFEKAGYQLIPYYNVLLSTIKPFNSLFKVFDLELDDNFIPNFLWGPIALREYYNSHSYYHDEYLKINKIEFSHIIVFLGALLLMQLGIIKSEKRYIIRMFQRAYDGPYLKKRIINDVSKFIPASNDYLKILDDINSINLEKVFEFLSLKEEERDQVDISLGGPMKIFLPINKERYFIDLAWISWILYTFFWGVRPNDQNFKGTALEVILNKRKSIIPTSPCKAKDGSKKQIDASYEIGDFLFIVECRAKGQSFAFEKGDIESISMRKKFIEEALTETDTKAEWLIKNPIGLNYNISKYAGIIPVLVTPFNEFIPSLARFYWLNQKYSRVFTPSELNKFIDDPPKQQEINLFSNVFWNNLKLTIHKT